MAKLNKTDSQTATRPPRVVVDPETGRKVIIKGVGALAGSGFKMRKDIDLTKPIAEQVFGPRKGRQARKP